MEFSKLSAPTLKELFIEELENMILSGRLPIGEKLPPERELAVSMQISRSVVNAGLAEMADKGFLEIIPRSGTYVADYRKKGKIETLVSIMKYNRGTLPDADILSILQIRKVLFTLAIELAMQRISDDEVDQLFKCSARLHEASSPEQAAQIVFEFDHLICNYSGNTLLPLIFYSFRAPNTALFTRYFMRYSYDTMIIRTDILCEAFKSRDTKTAVDCMTVAIDETISGCATLYNKAHT